MAGEALRREDALHARTRSFRARAGRAADVLAEAFDGAAKPAVAFSGGKDSLVTLALAARARPDVTAIWSDDELEHPETPGAIRAAGAALAVELVIVAGFSRHAGWFDPWRDAPFWREPDPAMIAIGMRAEAWQAQAGYDAVATGLRAAERAGRRVNARMRGLVYPAPENAAHRRAQPLAWWHLADVWAAIAAWGLPYNPVYDVLARAGVPRDLQRVGPLPLSPGWVLRAGWPADYRRLVERYGARWG